MTRRIPVGTMLALTIICDIWAASGTSVQVVWRNKRLNWGLAVPEQTGGWNSWEEKGALVKYGITNNAVSSCDTLLKMSEALCRYPSFNYSGTKIAFFRWGSRVVNNALTGANDSGYVCVIDANGTNFRTLCAMPGAPWYEQALDWPYGDWIYYVSSTYSTGDYLGRRSDVVRKVNAVSGENLLVCEINQGGESIDWFRRFELSNTSAGMWVGTQPGTKIACPNEFFTFPPANCDINQAAQRVTNCVPGCNAGLAPSADIMAGYMGGAHTEVYLYRWSHSDGNKTDVGFYSLAQAATWAGQSSSSTWIGNGCECIRFAVNSDKWFLQTVGWYGHAGNIGDGSNCLLTNWKDQIAVKVTNNPQASNAGNASGGDGTLFLNSGTGDFYYDGGSANVGKYEDENGVWHSMGSGGGDVTPPAVPTGLTATALSATQINLDWADNSEGDLDHYNVYRSTTSGFTPGTANFVTSVTASAYSNTGLTSATTYYYKVTAVDASSNASGASTQASATTQTAPPAAPTLTSPLNGAIDQAASPTLSWSTVSGAATYHVQVSVNSDVSSPAIQDSTLTTTSKALSGLSLSTTYYWRVRAKNTGGVSAWSTTWSFATAGAPPQPPSAPTLSAPLSGAIGISTSPTLSWTAGAGSVTSHVQVSSSSDFGTVIMQDSTLTGASKAVTGLTGNATYYWRARGKNSGGVSAWTTAWSFTTASITAVRGPLDTMYASVNDSSSGSFTWINIGSRNVAGSFDAGKWMMWKGVDFDRSSIEYAMMSIAIDAANPTGRYLDFRIDGTDGTVIASVPISGTGGWGTYLVEKENVLVHPTGVHNLYVVVRNGSMGTLDWVSLGRNTTSVAGTSRTADAATGAGASMGRSVAVRLPGVGTRTVNVFDLLGKNVYSQVTTASTITVPVTSLAAGVGFVRIVDSKGAVYTTRLTR